MDQCPSCGAPNDEHAEICGRCGVALPLAPGTVLGGRYEILAHIGRGGMGSVYRALDRALHEPVALKALRADVAASPEMGHRFLSEIRLARRVGHRNVCRIFEYGEDGPLRFIVMEYIEGTDLRRLIQQNGALPPAAAIDTLLQIAAGLEAIHELGVIHRDLKTANLMRDARGVVKLMDFGIAKEWGVEGATHATATGMALGTPEYMSPEQAQGEKVDFRSDVYSLGVVAFELLTGELPFRGTTPMATALKQIQEPPPLDGPRAARIPPPMIPVLRMCLAKRADERYQSIAEVIQWLQAARAECGGGPESATVGLTTGPASGIARPATPTPVQASPPPRPAVVAATPTPVRPAASTPARPLTPPARPVAASTPARALTPPPLPRPAPSVPSASRTPTREGSRGVATPGPRTPASLPSAPLLARPSGRAAGVYEKKVPRTRRLSTPVLLIVAALGLGCIVLGVGGYVLWRSLGVTTQDVTPRPAQPSAPSAAGTASETDAVGPSVAASPTDSLSPAASPENKTRSAEGPTPAAARAPDATAETKPRPTPGATRPPAPAAETARAVQPATPAKDRSVKDGPVNDAPVKEAPVKSAAPTVAAAPAGTLKLLILPWAQVSIDGKDVGTTPFAPLPLPPGPHVVRMSHPKFRPLTRRIEIQAGAVTRLDVNLNDEAFPLPAKE